MIHLFKSALARALTVVLVTILGAAVLLSAMRLALPYADVLRGQVAALVGERVGLAVQLGEMEVRLHGWRPQLLFRDARFLDLGSGHVPLGMDRLVLDLDLLASLESLAPQVGAVTLVGARLLVRRLADGRILVGGMEGGAQPGLDLGFFLHQGSFRLEEGELTWMDEDSGAASLVLSGVRAWFVNRDGRHRFALRAAMIDGADVGLRLVADLSGDAETPGDWDGQVYLGLSGSDLAPLVREPPPFGLKVASDGLRLDAWARLSAGRVDQVRTRLDLAGLALSRTPPGLPAESLQVQALGADLEWRRLADGSGWRLDAHDLRLVQRGAAWSTTGLALEWSSPSGKAWELRGGLGRVRLGQVLDLVQAAAPTLRQLLPLESVDAFDRLLDAHPDAAVRNLAWRLRGGGSAAPTWAVRAHLGRLRSAAAGPLPGVQGLDLDLAADQDGGQVKLSGAGSPTVLDLPGLLRAPLQLERLKGELSWRREADGRVRLEVPELVADHAAVATRTRLSLCLPAGGGSPFLDLRGHFGDGDVAKAKSLIPVGLLKPDLVGWLDRALVAGRVPSGAVVFRGRIEDFPFREQEGRLLVVLDVRDGVLDYLPGWPALTAVDGQVEFLNQSLDVVVEGAGILDSHLTTGTAQIDDLFNTKTLDIHASAEGPLGDGLRVLRESPLSTHLGRLAEAFEVTGGLRLGLDLNVPLQRNRPLAAAGRIAWPPGVRIGLKGTPVELLDPTGVLAFNTEGLAGEDLRASLWGAPVRMEIATLGAAQAERRTRVRATAASAVTALAKRLPSPLWSQLRGTLDWDLTIEMRNADVGSADVPIGFDLGSDLKRLVLRLPAPLGKAAGTSRALSLSGRFTPGVGVAADAQLGELSAHLDFAPQAGGDLSLTGGRILLGTEPAGTQVATAPKDGLWLTGRLSSLDGDAWQTWWAREGPALTQASERSSPEQDLLRGADLQFGRLTLGGMAWNDLRLQLRRGAGVWSADIDAAEAAGGLTLPDDTRARPIVARLTRFDLKALADGDTDGGGDPTRTEAQDQAAKQDAPDPRRAPGIDLEVGRLDWGKLDLGRLQLRANPRADGLDIVELSLKGALANATLTGAWTQAADGGAPATRVAAEGQTADLGALLRGLDYASPIAKAPATATASAAWPGSPADFALTLLAGRLGFEIGAGALLEVEPGVGRMLGILNVGALQRRLSLDFTDLFGKGYSFESITGDIALTRGQARIERFAIAGPAADVAVTGTADIEAGRLDQIATVTPKISTGVAVAGAVVAGPLVGAAVYLVDRVTGGVIDSLGSYRYRIEGPWDAPMVSPIGAAVLGGAADPGPGSTSRGAPDVGAGASPAGGDAPAPAPQAAPKQVPNPFLN